MDLHSILILEGAVASLDKTSETIYLVWDKSGGDGTDDLWPGAKRNAATQKRTAAAIRYRSVMAGKYAPPKQRSLLTIKECAISLV